MHWSAYEVFTVLSGIAVLAGTALPGETVKNRVLSACAGIVLVVMGVYIAAQDSGTYYYSPVIFVLPVLLPGMMIARLVQRRRAAERQ